MTGNSGNYGTQADLEMAEDRVEALIAFPDSVIFGQRDNASSALFRPIEMHSTNGRLTLDTRPEPQELSPPLPPGSGGQADLEQPKSVHTAGGRMRAARKPQKDATQAPILRGQLPLLGVLPALARDSLQVIERARDLGDVVQLAVPGRHPLFVLATPEHIRRVLQDNHANYRRTPFHDRMKVFLGEGLVTSEGALWQRQRRLLQPAFRAEPIRRFVAAMAASAVNLAERWKTDAAGPRIVDVSQEMSVLALDIAVRCMFGREQRGDDAKISQAVSEVLDWFANRFWSIAPDWTERLPTPTNRRFRRALAALDGVVEGIVAERLNAGDVGDDLLGMLLAAQGEEGGGIDARQVRDEVMTMLVAGHETSAAALTWILHLLALHPQVGEAVRDEVERVLGGRTVPEVHDLGRLELTRAVVQEAMRLYPPAGIPRLAVGPDWIGGYAIPAGAIIILNPWLVQRDPRFWPDPERFDPARFAPGERPAPYTYFPFGGGPRTCMGNHFAMTEMLVTLAVLVRRVRLRHASDASVRPQFRVTLRPAGGLPMRVEHYAQAR